MNFLLIIDNLGSGGAERQCVTLAIELRKLNYGVRIMGYSKGDHYYRELQNHDIEYILIETKNSIDRLISFRKKIRNLKPDVLIAFLQTPSLLAEISSVPSKSWVLIVSERNNIFKSLTPRIRLHLFFHRFADYLITNSFETADAICLISPQLRRKIRVIYNGVDTEKFRPCKFYVPGEQKHFLAIASHQRHKNARNLILALKKLKESGLNPMPKIFWYGSDTSEYTGKSSVVYHETIRLIEDNDLSDYFILKPQVNDIENVYQRADALILTSFREGLPNSVCEAMACGLPILMSKVSDYLTLTEGNGIYFDPGSVESISNAIRWFCGLKTNEIVQMRNQSRQKAESLFSLEKFVFSYIKLVGPC